MSRRDQPDLFGIEAAPTSYRADPDRVRARLQRILGAARTAETLPWSRAELRLYRTIVPQMTLWLPDDEAAHWRFEFEAELERLQAARRPQRRYTRRFSFTGHATRIPGLSSHPSP